MKKLIFTKGDETRPKFEDLTNAETYNSSIFSDVYDRAFSLIYEIANPPKQNNPEHNRERNNIIAFIGERGSGKTSCLKSIYHSLYKDNTKSLHHKVLRPREGKGLMQGHTAQPGFWAQSTKVCTEPTEKTHCAQD